MSEVTFVNGLGSIAKEYGLKEAVFLHNLMFWVRVNRSNGVNFKDGRWWSYNTFEGLAQLMPWWTAKQIRAVVKNCEEKGALLVGDFNENRQLRTLWYSPSDAVLQVYGDDWTGDAEANTESICPFGQTERAEPNAQTGKCLIGIKNNNKKKTPIAPKGDDARFEKFWRTYRDVYCAADHSRAGDKTKARKAWSKLQLDDALAAKLWAYLKAQMQTDLHRRGFGIQYASTFLNAVARNEIDLTPVDASPAAPAAFSQRAAPEEPQEEAFGVWH